MSFSRMAALAGLAGVFLVRASDLSALRADDECQAEEGAEGCGLNALQTKGHMQAAAINSTKDDPRFAMDNESDLLGFAPPPHPRSHRFMATSTRYGTNPQTACMLDSAALVAGTDYLPVASAEAMQNGCCKCNGNGGGGGAAGMGCGACAKGRFIRKLPRGYKIWTPESADIFSKEYNIVVADICPGGDNAMWCPSHAGQKNKFGVQNHFDFAKVPANFDNFYFEFTPTACSGEIQSRLKRMSKCR
mmetsp:Transcript_101389/g.180249  ORF Transcript_101389/g.180249 Transcript_101389/m.180249 type:complete len:247 (-) Transcript_101389:87-827(-)|eukprot:CAMPEP_0197664368 /NCGR_PEP_ID=MMETSP1338-20131121/58589_1 /TAXON_ID=43686 ORGANISM="Pelagodinium beii, Strain RCC1491" /NCGR_SAMPLE_ID=MMETSP1338 /ASSEMBLY_ACC=CAM_ASM_000754 /LENGTH=246 /DNA_ID=CAMNT_0043242985 /DNA_START=45 /DNA_END=785 /DNA_ORIENTATION=-